MEAILVVVTIESREGLGSTRTIEKLNKKHQLQNPPTKTLEYETCLTDGFFLGWGGVEQHL